MLESLFILMILIAFVLFLLSIDKESIVLCILGTVSWLYIMLNALWVEVPFSTTDGSYMEYSFSGFCLIFVFAELVFAISLYQGWVGDKGISMP